MNILPIKVNNVSFKAKFPTKDVLSFITDYPLTPDLDKMVKPKIIKEMTGLDLKSDKFSFSENDWILDTVIENRCIDEMVKQNPILKESLESCQDVFWTTHKDKKQIKSWLNTQMKRIGKEVDLKPFRITTEEIKSEYQSLLDCLEKIHF